MNAPELAPCPTKVVLVEDDLNSLEFMNGLLELWGYQVKTYDDPTDAIQAQLLDQNAPNLIISDLRFATGIDGFELIHSLRALHKHLHIPALVLTGDIDPLHAKSAAANDIQLLHKPVRSSHLQRVLHELCSS